MKIFWIKFTSTTLAQIMSDLPGILVSEKWKEIFTPNPEMLLQQAKDQEFRDILQKADYQIPDGIGLYVAAQMLEYDSKLMRAVLLPYFFFHLFFKRDMLYKKYGERICGSDLTREILNYAENNNIKITIVDPYFPNDLPKVASQLSFERNLSEKFPKLQFDFFVYSIDKKKKIIQDIKASDSKILFSTLGMKKQEKSVLDIMSECPNIKLWLGVGSSFDYFVGFQKRAPRLWSIIWLEWLYRLIFSHNRSRQLSKVWNAIFVFLWQVIKN